MSCHSLRRGCIQVPVRTRITYLNDIKIKLDRAEAFFKDIELVCGTTFLPALILTMSQVVKARVPSTVVYSLNAAISRTSEITFI